MSDMRLARLAEIILHYSVNIQPGDWVLINTNLAALPLTNEVSRQIWAAGGRTSLHFESDALNEIFLSTATDETLSWLSPIEQALFEQVNIILYLDAAEDTRVLAGASPERMRLYQRGRGMLRQIRSRRAQSEGLRWVYTQFPCNALAQEAGMGLEAYQDFAYRALHVDQPDPVKSWQAIQKCQQTWVDWLKDRQQVILRGPNIDLQLSIAGRKFINGSGQENLPDGEIFTGPVETSANGWVRFSYPAIFNGRSVEGVELRFENGKVVSAQAARDEAFLLSMLESDAGACFIGEFAIGTNYAIRDFTHNILYDEKIGGTIHLALGNGYPETGSLNRSSIHWDLICDMRRESEIVVDGDRLCRNGEFQL